MHIRTGPCPSEISTRSIANWLAETRTTHDAASTQRFTFAKSTMTQHSPSLRDLLLLVLTNQQKAIRAMSPMDAVDALNVGRAIVDIGAITGALDAEEVDVWMTRILTAPGISDGASPRRSPPPNRAME